MPQDRQRFPEAVAQARRRAGYFMRTLQFAWQAAPNYATLWLILLVIQGILPAAVISLSGMLLDRMMNVPQVGISWPLLQPVVNVVAAFSIVVLLLEIVQAILNWLWGVQSEVVHDYLSSTIQARATTVDFAFFEMSHRHEHLDRIRSEAIQGALALLESSGTIVRHGVTFLALIAVLTRFGIWIPLVLLLSTIPILYAAVLTHQRYSHWWHETKADRRQAHYYNLLLTFPQAAAEVRVFGLGHYFQARFSELRGRLRSTRGRTLRWQTLVHLAAGGVSLLMIAVAAVWLGWRALRGLASIGDLVIFYQVFSRGQVLIRLLLSNAGNIFSNAAFLEGFFDFLDEPQHVRTPDPALPAPAHLAYGIQFRNVTFRYPGKAMPTLDRCNLFLPAGALIAVVGTNGSGKSTLIKLLCRFYDPSEGRITIDGVDIRNMRVEALHGLMSVLFQFPLRYHGSAAENIALSNPTLQNDNALIEAAARSARIHEAIMQLPQGYATKLEKDLNNGTEFSGSQWQRIAIARALMRNTPLVLLDEPTSCMDPRMEVEWLNQVRILLAGKTTLMLTQRFTTAMHADQIVVLDEGRVIELGTHADLLAKNDVYARLWRAQMQAAHPESGKSALSVHSRVLTA